MRRTVALLVFGVVVLGAAPAHAATLTKAKFRAGALETRWALDSGDCAGSLALSGRRTVDAYGFFTGWTVAWGGGNCLATSNTRALGKRDGTYRLQGRALPRGTYYVQVRYCHDSDFSGNYFCRATNPLGVSIPSAVAGTLSRSTGSVSVEGRPAHAGMKVGYGDDVETGGGGSATFDPSGGGELELGEGSTLIPLTPAAARLRSGRATASLHRYYRLSSPNAVAAVTDARFRLVARRSWTRVRTHAGTVAFGNTRGAPRAVSVAPGYESTVRGSNAPTAPRRY